MNPQIMIESAKAHQRDLQRAAGCCRMVIGRAHQWRLPHRATLRRRKVEVRAVPGLCCI
jgi:hypothetical protein